MIECCVDAYATAVTEALAELHSALPDDGADPLVLDLFCGSGNFSHHLGARLGITVHAAELDPDVHDATRHNLGRITTNTELHLGDYADLLGKHPPRGTRGTYFVEPPIPIDRRQPDPFRPLDDIDARHYRHDDEI
ncbi:hypothetical protein [Streptomyces sp. NPDC089799]|uniref:hypothetical protein n=1 Tax=Streptomyces sp. NPDC089799 TaxID=3155066 RepID=UPI003416FB74